mgnify:CR=1 FL=1
MGESEGTLCFQIGLDFLRQSKQINQVQLSEKLNVTKQTISNWENGTFFHPWKC